MPITSQGHSRPYRLGRWMRRRLGPPMGWPAWAAAAAALAILLGPLSLDLFLALPWSVRGPLGQAVCLSLLALGLVRLCRVRPSDTWPAPPVAGDRPDPRIRAALWLATLALALPMLAPWSNLGWSDWDYFLEKYEAVRQSILLHGEFPWWTPWCRGGFPLAADPQVGVVSVATPLVLAFGTSVGLRLATIVCLLIAVEGAYRLAWIWTRQSTAAAAAALVYALSGAACLSVVTGYFIPMSYGVIPWMAYEAFRLGRARGAGAWLGFWSVFGLLNGLQYLSVHGALLAAAILVRGYRLADRPTRLRMARGLAVALGVVLALGGWRLVTVGLVMRDYPRIAHMLWPDQLDHLVRTLLARPAPSQLDTIPLGILHYFFECGCYIGVPAAVLVVSGLRRGWRWWHTLAVLGFWLSLGSSHWTSPGFWLKQWPLFGTMHVVPRWRFLGLLGLALAVADELSRWCRSRGAGPRHAATALTLALAADYLALAAAFFPQAFRIPPSPDLFPRPAVAQVIQRESGLGYAHQLQGYGLIRGYQPVLGYRRDAPTARLWQGHPAYVGEAWTDRGPVRPVAWTPNRIRFQVEPGQIVHVNQNPGSWWLANGRRVFPAMRCAEPLADFAARADAAGRLVLHIRPPGLPLAAALHALGLAILAGAAWIRPRRAQAPPGSATTRAEIPSPATSS